MRDQLNCLLTVVSLYCDDNDDCVFTNYDVTGGWTIGSNIIDGGGVAAAASAGSSWPHQVMSWEYLDTISGEMESDPQLTVTGNMNGNILCLDNDIISTVEGAPGYPENLIVTEYSENLIVDGANLAGVYRRQGDSRVWKYGDFELSFNGKYL